MGFWSRAIRALRRTDPPAPAGSRVFHVPRTTAGVHVTADTALKNAVVWACVRYLSSTIAQLPWHVMRKVNGAAEHMNTNPADWLLSKRPCPDMGAFSWRQSMVATALLRGNAFAEIERDNRGAAYALWPIHPDRVRVLRDDAGALVYEVRNSGSSVIIAASDMFHLRGLGDGPMGYSVIEWAAESIGWAQATEIFGAAYFGQGMNPTGIVEVPSTTELSVDAQEELRKELKRLYGGPKGERTVILDAGMKFQKIANTPEDSQFIETRQHQVEEICRWFGVPPHKVMHLLRATFSNIEHQSIEVVIDAVTPWIKALEEEADYKLFGQNRQGFYTKIDTRALLRGDHAARGIFYKTLFELGALNTNEIRDLEDFNGIGTEGDRRFVSTNLQPLDAPVSDMVDPADTIDLTDPKSVERALNGQRLSH